jgi:hypothetical protein
MTVIDSIKETMKEGETFTAKVGRKNAAGTIDTVTLKTVVSKATQVDVNVLEPMTTADNQQKLVQQAWLTVPKENIAATTAPANVNDVASIDAIVKATYTVISGPAGPRNWDRFSSLFLPEARLGASVVRQGKPAQFRSFTPADYQKSNAPFFMKSGFYEEELNRKVFNFGNVANVASSYQFKVQPDGKVEQRGINYFTLVKSNGRWWISNLTWQDEDTDNKLPADMEKK